MFQWMKSVRSRRVRIPFELLGEEMARQFCRWDPEMKIIGLRFSNIMEPHDYAAFPDFEKIRTSGNGTFGVTSMRATPRRQSALHLKRHLRAQTCS